MPGALRNIRGVGGPVRRVALVVVAVLAIAGGAASAKTTQTWNGNADSSDWFNGGNWDGDTGNTVPTTADFANITQAGAAVVIDSTSGSAQWRQLNVQAASGGASLTIKSDANSGANDIVIGKAGATVSNTIVVDGGGLSPAGGITINGNGTLVLVNGSFSFTGSNHAISVNAGGTLEVDGLGMTLAGTSTSAINLNNQSKNTTSIAGVNMTDSTSTLKFVLGTSGVSPFVLVNNETFILNGNLNVDLGDYIGPTGAGSSITLIDYSGTGSDYSLTAATGPLTGTFVGVGDGDTVAFNGFTAKVNYDDGMKVTLTDIQLAATAVPEPGACAVLGLGGLLAVRRRR